MWASSAPVVTILMLVVIGLLLSISAASPESSQAQAMPAYVPLSHSYPLRQPQLQQQRLSCICVNYILSAASIFYLHIFRFRGKSLCRFSRQFSCQCNIVCANFAYFGGRRPQFFK